MVGLENPMLVVLLLAITAVVVIMSYNNSSQVPWISKMRRLHAGSHRKGEWMAPDEVVKQVVDHYLASFRWMDESLFMPLTHRWASAPLYLAGTALQRHRQILSSFRHSGLPRCVGVLRCDQQIEVRSFSEDGECCVVVDHQTQRRMTTYDTHTQARIFTQDLGEGTVVYKLKYDLRDRRWKIESLVQELPLGWDKPGTRRQIQEFSSYPMLIGRDH